MNRKGILFVMIFVVSLLGCTDNVTTTTTTTAQITEVSTLEEESCSFNISIDVSNGVEQIQTEFVSILAYGTGDDEFTADGIAATYNMVDHIVDFSSINLTDDLVLVKNSAVTEIEIFDLQGNLISTWDSLNESSNLDTGEYIVRLSTSTNESTCYISGYNYFILNVE